MNYYLSFLIKASVTKWVGRVVWCSRIRQEKESGRLDWMCKGEEKSKDINII